MKYAARESLCALTGLAPDWLTVHETGLFWRVSMNLEFGQARH